MMNKLHKMIARIQLSTLREALQAHPVVVLHGARQTGKTTLCRIIDQEQSRHYLTLDDFDVLDQARRSPSSLVDTSDPMTIDEVQRCPELILQVKATVDRDRRPGRFLLTGSADLLLMKQVSDSLAGRAIYVTLPPLTWGEIQECPTTLIKRLLGAEAMEDLWDSTSPIPAAENVGITQAIRIGGFPVPALELDLDERVRWFESYVKTYLERDLRDLSNVASLPDFRRMMRLMAIRNGTLLNVSALARDAGLTVPTARRYVNLLEVSHLVTRLLPFTVNRGKRLVKAPKVYWTDTGLALHLAGAGHESGRSLENRELGAAFEAWVVSHLLTHAKLMSHHVDLWHWRTSHGQEVDVVIENAHTIIPVEIKATRQPTGRDLRGLDRFMELHPDAPFGVVICRCPRLRRLSPHVVALPVDALLLS